MVGLQVTVASAKAANRQFAIENLQFVMPPVGVAPIAINAYGAAIYLD
jgi:hypothetical protein